MTDIGPMTVKLMLRWEDDEDGDPVFWAGPFKAGYVSLGGDDGWYVSGYFGPGDFEDYATKAEAMAALQAVVLKALAE